jgi:hypothetical protein
VGVEQTLATTSWTVLSESIRPILPTRIVPNRLAFRKLDPFAVRQSKNDSGAIL